jgi:hypothetical protein
MEIELRDTRRLTSSVEQNRLSPAKEGQIKLLQEKIQELLSTIDKDRAEQVGFRLKSE